jgi:hypothetical protein
MLDPFEMPALRLIAAFRWGNLWAMAPTTLAATVTCDYRVISYFMVSQRASAKAERAPSSTTRPVWRTHASSSPG